MDVIQSLWIGSELTILERLSISSFLAHGHPFHLYVYTDVAGIPPGVTAIDAGTILPASAVFKYRDFDTYSGFSNFFRYQLLLDRGGWWVDLDVVCLRPFEFSDPHVFSSERDKSLERITSGIIRAPSGSPSMAYASDVCRRKDPARLGWGETGPRLLAEAVRRTALESQVHPSRVFCPVAWNEWDQVLDPDRKWSLREAYSVHLWNEMWRRYGRDKNACYHTDSLFERLKRRFSPEPGARVSSLP